MLCPMIRTVLEQPSEVARDREYEVRQLATKYGLTEEQARELIASFGNEQQKLEAAAKSLP